MKSGPITRLEAAAIRDAAGVKAAPGVVLVQDGRILDAGPPEKLGPANPEQDTVRDLRDRLLMPALVNAHAHLDLTHAPAPPADVTPAGSDEGFLDWLRHVIAQRPTEPEAIAAAIRDGLNQSWEQGTGTLGDIAGSIHAITARHDHAADALPDDGDTEHALPARGVLPGVSYLELFGRGKDAVKQTMSNARTQLDEVDFELPVPGHDRGILLGLSPHAPYSCDRHLLREAVKLAQAQIYRLCIHLAESRAELDFVRNGTGPFQRMLEQMGKDSRPAKDNHADHPVDWIKPLLNQARWALVHANHTRPQDFATLARDGGCVVYCPAASDYFAEPRDADGQPRPHPYRDMLDAGITVALGTDSPLCQPPDEASPWSIWAQMRRLRHRDGIDPGRLLTMATVYGYQALELPDDAPTLRRGASAALVTAELGSRPDGTDPLTHALDHCDAVQPVDWSGHPPEESA